MTTYHDERGMASFISLCIMLLVIMFASGVAYFVRQGQRNTWEYMRETELRLASEGAVEEYALQVMAQPELVKDMKRGGVFNRLPPHEDAERNIITQISVMPKNDSLYIAGVSRDTEERRGAMTWRRMVLAKAELKDINAGKGRAQYVWQSWLK